MFEKYCLINVVVQHFSRNQFEYFLHPLYEFRQSVDVSAFETNSIFQSGIITRICGKSKFAKIYNLVVKIIYTMRTVYENIQSGV